MCGTGAASRRLEATENCFRCQTAEKTAAAGVEEFECLKKKGYFSLKVAQNRCFSVSKLHS